MTHFIMEKTQKCLILNINLLVILFDPIPLKGPYTQLFIFIVENLNDFISTVNGLELNFLMAATLAGITLSSVRVVMLTRTQGTPFDGFNFISNYWFPKGLLRD